MAKETRDELNSLKYQRHMTMRPTDIEEINLLLESHRMDEGMLAEHRRTMVPVPGEVLDNLRVRYKKPEYKVRIKNFKELKSQHRTATLRVKLENTGTKSWPARLYAYFTNHAYPPILVSEERVKPGDGISFKF